MTELYVNDNRITTMNLSKNKKLQYLYINNNCLISGCLMTGYTGMEMVKMEGQTKTVKAKKKKGGYLIPVPSLKKTNVISKVSKGKVKNKGIFVKGKPNCNLLKPRKARQPLKNSTVNERLIFAKQIQSLNRRTLQRKGAKRTLS